MATIAHAGQMRKITGEPYIFHPMRVMLKAAHFGDKYGIVAIAHDTVEDTELTLKDWFEAGFSVDIVDAIDILTKRKGTDYDEYLKNVRMNPLALAVKILDIEDNLSDIETIGLFDVEWELNTRRKYVTALKFLRGR